MQQTICNSRPRTPPPYYKEGANRPACDVLLTCTIPVLSTLNEVSTEELLALVVRLRDLASWLDLEQQANVRAHPVLEAFKAEVPTGRNAWRHLHQQSSMIGHMQDAGLLEQGCFVELGAGRGRLLQMVHAAMGATTPSDYLAVDRAHVRYTGDRRHINTEHTEAVRFARATIDIEHLELSAAPVVAETKWPVVLCGKHLCGAATDLALICAQRYMHESEAHSVDGIDNVHSRAAAKLFKPDRPVLRGLCIALCCHQCCDWSRFVNRPYFQALGFSARDFKIIALMSSWAVCGDRTSGQQHRPDNETSTVNQQV